MSLFDVFIKGKQIEDNQQEEKDFFPVNYPQHPKGAVFLKVDTNLRNIIAANIGGALERMRVNLVPILDTLGLLTKENLYKFSGLETRDLKEKLKEAYIKVGGAGFMFDELTKNEEFRHKFTFCQRPQKDYWVCIDLKEATPEQREWYGARTLPFMDVEKLNPFFEVWLSGRQLEKYEEYKRLIDELNKFFERGANPDLVRNYFGCIEFQGDKIVENPELFRKDFVLSEAIKEKQEVNI